MAHKEVASNARRRDGRLPTDERALVGLFADSGFLTKSGSVGSRGITVSHEAAPRSDTWADRGGRNAATRRPGRDEIIGLDGALALLVCGSLRNNPRRAQRLQCPARAAAVHFHFRLRLAREGFLSPCLTRMRLGPRGGFQVPS